LEALLEASGQLCQQKIKYTVVGKWNCSSTTAHLLREAITDPKAKDNFNPNKLSPYTPQQFFNRALKVQHSTLHGPRASSFIRLIKNLQKALSHVSRSVSAYLYSRPGKQRPESSSSPKKPDAEPHQPKQKRKRM
jgi:hypothetical protein